MSQTNPAEERSGPIAYMATNRVAANLLTIAILAAGFVAMSLLEREAWPTLPFNTVEISMAYPGASPDEVEESIVTKIEGQVRALEQVRRVRSMAAPGVASIRVEFESGTDIDRALDEVESAVARIETFPVDAERPEFREMSNRQSMIRLIVHGNISERALKEFARQVEEQLTSLPSVSYVETMGARDYEISIEVPLVRLRALGLTLQDVAQVVARSSLDLSAGSIDTDDSQFRIRTLGQRYDQQAFEDIVLITSEDGAAVRLDDIAIVRDSFENSDLIVRYDGKPAVFIEVFRADGEQVMDVAAAVHEYIANVVEPSLPKGIGVTVWNDDSQTYTERLNLLLKNGLLGLMLVFIALAVFLQIRLASWVIVGLLTSGIGAFVVMIMLDLAINAMSLFSFVLAIGIIVDDAIIVSESIHRERMQGAGGVAAAIRGAKRVRGPLTFAVLTSITAFVPLLYIPGGIGEVWRALPIIVITMLVISLIDSLLILPRHLSHLPGPDRTPTGIVDRLFAGAQARVNQALNHFVSNPLDRVLQFATRQPAIILASAFGLLVVSASLLPAGIVPARFVDVVEGDFVNATIEMPDGTTANRTLEVAMEIEAAGQRVLERLSREHPEAGPLAKGVIVTVGQTPRVEGGGLDPAPTLNPPANIAAVEFKLAAAQGRDISAITIMEAWRTEVGFLPHARGIAFSGELINLGSPVHVVFSHPDPERLNQIADSVVANAESISGVFDVRSDHSAGIREMQLTLRPEARILGITLDDLARQVHSAYFGAEALRIQRDGEDVPVYVRLPADERNAITDVESYFVRTPSGAHVSLDHVASLTVGNSAPSIQRQDGQRVVTVTADVDDDIISGSTASAFLSNNVLEKLSAADPQFTYSFGGEQQQQIESLDALYWGFALAMLFIFALLATSLGSYGMPVIVMAIIPFGIVGVMFGHLVLGISLTAGSLLGFFGLSGVVVNDSLVMIDFIKQRLSEGVAPRNAIIEGAKGRFRPIFLTSLTTFLAFTPLILERAIQAQFFVPFAASLGVGILVSTAMLMVLVPALMAIYLRVNVKLQPSVGRERSERTKAQPADLGLSPK